MGTYTYCSERVYVYNIKGICLLFTQETYFILFFARVVVVILLAVNRVYRLCIYAGRFIVVYIHNNIYIYIYIHTRRKDFISNLLKRYFIPRSEYPLLELIFLSLSLYIIVYIYIYNKCIYGQLVIWKIEFLTDSTVYTRTRIIYIYIYSKHVFKDQPSKRKEKKPLSHPSCHSIV